MTTTVRSLAPQYDVIELVHSDVVKKADMLDAAKEVAALSPGGVHRVLADWSAVTALPDNITLVGFGEAATKADLPADFRHAHVWPEELQARLSLDMWKTVESNTGHHVRVFGTRDAALEWLTS
jgi:hypothetical protein